MTQYFWVGGGASTNWNATSNTNWALTSGGARLATTLPVAGDTCTFDNNSVGPAVANVAISLAALDFGVGGTQYLGTFTHNTGITITISAAGAPALRMSPGMTYAPASSTSLITFSNTSGIAQFTSAGKVFAAITLNGVGGTVQQQDGLTINAVAASILSITNGVWDCNGNTLSVNALSSSNSNTRSLILGGTVTLGFSAANNTTIWTTATTTGLTFIKNAANIVVSAPTNTILGGWTFSSNVLTFNGLTVNSSTVGNILNLATSGSTFSSLAVGSGWTIALPAALTISSAFTLVGTQARPISLINAALQNNVAALSCPSGACSLTWGVISGVAVSGGATFTAINTFDMGAGNSGWAFTPPNDVAGVNVTQIAGSAAAANALGKATNTVARGVVAAGATPTSVTTSALTIGPLGAAATGIVLNQFGSTGNATRTLIFDGDTLTPGLRGAEGTIAGNTASNTPVFTVSALPATPQVGDSFSVV